MIYLFPFTFGPPSLPTYPAHQSHVAFIWPERINKWAQGPSLESLGAEKFGFFSETRWLNLTSNTLADVSKNYWNEETSQYILWKQLIQVLHNEHLWFLAEDSEERDDDDDDNEEPPPSFWNPKNYIKIRNIPQALKDIISSIP